MVENLSAAYADTLNLQADLGRAGICATREASRAFMRHTPGGRAAHGGVILGSVSGPWPCLCGAASCFSLEPP